MIDDGECSNCISASVLRTWCTVHAAACFTLNHRDGNESFTFKFLTRTHVRVHTRVVVLVYVTVPLFSRSQADDSGSKFWLDEFSAATKKGTECMRSNISPVESDLDTVATAN